ncbi:MAG TPA: lipase secretion chaperone, partial [Rhizobacter sp.]|nr:lipase secretion chaperone [Rhizobacter sp.]
MAAFSTPFWATLVSVSAVAAGVSYLSQAADSQALRSPAQAMLDSSVSALRDVPMPDDAEKPPETAPASSTLRAASPFTIDTLGRLVVSDKTLAVLDSWLLLAGRGQDLAPLEPRLRTELPPLAAERAWQLIRSHAAYRQAERELLQQLKSQPPLSARDLLDKTMALRRRHFDSVSVQELFGVQEARGLYASEVARILADTTLSEAQQAQRILALRMNLPPEVAAQEFAGSEFSFAMEKQAALMREQGENDVEVAYMRKQFVDTEGARSVLEVENEQLQARKQAWE